MRTASETVSESRVAELESAEAGAEDQDVSLHGCAILLPMTDPETARVSSLARDVALIVGAVGATAAVGGLATAPAVDSRWYRRLNKPPWQPPGAVFGPAWTVLYALLAASMVTV